MENLKPIKKVDGIINKFCYTIGLIPTSYLLSLTYEEQILAIGKYLEDTVLPAINNNAEATAEVQQLYNDLKSYVDNYFDNLDVTQEINDKLDAMAESGELGEIIENHTSIPQMKQDIKKLERKAIYIGNSYTEGTGSSTGHNGLFNLTKDLYKEAYKYVTSGGGFLHDSAHNINFEDLLDNAINDTSFNNEEITDIIIIGAWGESRTLGELGRSTFISQMTSAVNSFVSKVKNNFANVNRIEYYYAETRAIHNVTQSSTGTLNLYNTMFDVHNIVKDLLPACGIAYKGWLGFNTIMNSTLISNDNIHPNDNGYKKLASLFKEAQNGGITYNSYYQYFNTQNSINTSSFIRGFIILHPDQAEIIINRIFISGNQTPAVNTAFNLIDQTGLQYAIPCAYGYNLNLGYMRIATENTYNSTNDIIFRIAINIANNEPVIQATPITQKTPSAGIDYAVTSQSTFIITFASR